MAVRPDEFDMQDDLAAADASTEDFAPKRRRTDYDDEAGGGRARRRGGLMPTSVWGRSLVAAGLLVVLGGMTAGGMMMRSILLHNERFTVGSSESIEIHGNAHVLRADLLSVFGADLERNVFHVPLAERRAELERLSWVKHATVMRLLPDRLRIEIEERTPVAFVRQGTKIDMVDANGVLLEMPAAQHYSFPVVTGIAESDPASVRAARMKLYMDFMKEMDSSGQKVSENLSEVDLSSPEDVRALIPEGTGEVLVHFGESDYLARYRKFEQHLPEWRTQYPRLASVDMRYDRQVVLEMQPGAETSAPAGDVNPAPAAAAAPAGTTAGIAKNDPLKKPEPPAKPALVPAKSAKAAAKAKKAAATKAMLARGRVLKEHQAQTAN